MPPANQPAAASARHTENEAMISLRRRRGATRLLAGGLVCAALLRADDKLPGRLRPSPAEAREAVDIVAEHFAADEATGWVTARGNVVVRHGDTELRADRVQLNTVSGEVIAEGHVLLVRLGQGATSGERLAYNYKTGEGLTSAMDLRTGLYRVRAEESRRRADGTIDLKGVSVTTCTNQPGRWHYHVRGRTATLRPDDYVAVQGATPVFMGLPFFYLPWWRKDLDRHYGWRFVPGYESDWGAFLLSTYKFRLIDLGDGDRVESRTHLDYRTERGPAIGEDLVWQAGPPGERSEGFVSVYYLDDDRPMDADYDRDPMRDLVEEDRYRFTVRHDAFLSPRDRLLVRASYLSDSYLLEDFYHEEYRRLVQPDNFATYTHVGDDHVAGLGVYRRLNKFYDSVNRLPDAWFDVLRTEIGDSPVYYESQSRGGWIERAFADYDNPSNMPAADYDTMRFDTRHAFYLPQTLFGFLNVVPRAAYRGTYYDDSRRQETRTLAADAGGRPVTETVDVADGASFRSLFELGLESSFKAYGLFEDNASRYRHVVEPYVNYTFMPRPNLRPRETYHFDAIDTLDKTHQARFGTRQQIQRKTGERVRTPLDADIYGIYAFETAEAGDDAGLRIIGLDSIFRPADNIRLQVDAEYDVDESEMDFVNTWLSLWHGDLWEASGEFFYRPDECTLFSGGLTYALSDAWSCNLNGRYEAETSRLEEVGGYLQYCLDCLAFRLRGCFLPGFTRDDGSERKDEYRISFYVWLRAFPPSRIERTYLDRDR